MLLGFTKMQVTKSASLVASNVALKEHSMLIAASLRPAGETGQVINAND
jgi:hypothetical protein